MKYVQLATLTLAFSLASFAQEFRGTLSGSITDPSGSAIAGANITITEEHTGTKVATVSGNEGQYTAPFLLPGDYDIFVQLQGFKQFTRKGVHVGSGDHPVIDIKLEVGDTTQAVEVTADAPLLDAENASVGQSITTKEVEEMPLNGRTPIMLAQLAIGVVASGNPTLVHPFDSGSGGAWVIGGSVAQTHELLIDGSPDGTWDGRLAYSPPQDAVQEVRVKAFDSDAAFGHTGGGTLNQVMKTGTNSLHGSLWEFNQASNLTANSFFNNKNGLGNPLTHYNQYGLTVGGPMVIPHLYNGHNKLFWFFAWENLKDSQPNTNFTSVPTDAERRGDFSRDALIYNPYTAVQNGTTITRQPFPGNIIPTSLLNPIALAYLKYYPEPNVATTRPDGSLNYGNNATTNDNFNNELGRLDYNMSDRSRMFFNVRKTGYDQLKNNYFGNVSQGSVLFRNNWGSSLDEVYTINPTNVLNVRLNFTRMQEIHANPSDGFNPTQLGLPAYLASNSQYLQLPYVAFSGSCGSQTSFQCLGSTGDNVIPSQSLQLFATWVSIKGNHTIKTGFDGRQYRLNTFTAGNSAGSFSFTSNNWVRASSSASSTVGWGQDFASFLLGLPNGGSYDTNSFGSYYSYYLSGFVQDDWRIRSNLTVNIGLRFDHDGPYNEKYGRTVDGFNTTTPNPLAAAAIAAYAKNPVAQLSPQNFLVNGGLTFASPSSTAVYQNTSHLFSPRVGVAWTPAALHNKTVIRAGFGMFVTPITIAFLGPNGNYSSSPILDQQGFSQTTSLIATNNNYLTPAATLNNPFPNGFLQPVGSALGLATFAGQAVSFLNPEMKSPYSLRWNFGFQHSLSNNMVLEVVYMGNHGVHLPVDVTQLNGIPRQYLSTLPTRDPAVSYLTNTVANPFAGLNTSQNGTSTTTAQLLARYPQFPLGYSNGSFSGSGGVLEQNLNVGSSYYQSLNARLQKRLSQGLSVTANYIYSRLIERTTWLNDTDAQPEKRISPFDHPHRFVLAVSYDLPIGKGRAIDLQSRWTNFLFGGWHLNSIYTFQVGAPITWVNGSSTTPGDYVYLGGPISLNNRQTNTAAFNTGAFDTRPTDQFQYHIRTFSTAFPNIRQDGINEWDPSMLKLFHMTERAYFQLRFEFFNVVNHPTFSAPNTTATNSAFGLITAQSNRPRTIQVGGRIVF